MPLEKVSANDVYARLRDNKSRIYPSDKRGAERLMPFAAPTIEAGFQFNKDSAIFATGSCFARNVEKSLHFIGANVVSSPTDIPAPPKATQIFQLYNKYTVHSILNELRWALSGKEVDHSALLVADKDGNYYDLQVASSSEITGTKEEMTAFRKAYNDSFKAAGTADVVIITLGLVECWYDTELEVYLNMAPPKPLTQLYPGRFEFHLLDYNDIYNALVEIEGLLRNGNPNPPEMLVTVSPVGLAATFRTSDVLVANQYSKSVQRAAVEAFVMSHRASYFPSYEFVMLTDHKFAWGNKDFRHVRQETVDRIMAEVLRAYVGPSDKQQLLYVRGHATAYFDDGQFEKAIEIIEPHIEEFSEEGDILWLFAQSLRQVERRKESITFCRKLMHMNIDPSRSAGLTAMNTARMSKENDLLEELKSEHLALFPEDLEKVADITPIVAGPTESPEIKAVRNNAARLFDDRDYDGVIAVIEPQLTALESAPDLIWTYAQSLRQVGRREDSITQCRILMNMDVGQSLSAGRTAVNTMRMLKDPVALEDLKREFLAIFPQDSKFIEGVK